jgi:hypothetical protein
VYDFSFWYAGLPDCTVVPDAQTCETCETCWLIVSSSALDLAKFTVVSGTWSIVGGNLRATTTGTILLGDAWINDNLRIGWAPTCGTYPFRARYLFSWVDDNNYWCIEWRNGIIGTHAVWARIIERVGGSETIHVDLPIGIIDAVDIWNCILWYEYRFGTTACFGGGVVSSVISPNCIFSARTNGADTKSKLLRMRKGSFFMGTVKV